MDVMNYKFDRRKITDARIAKDLTQRELGELAKKIRDFVTFSNFSVISVVTLCYVFILFYDVGVKTINKFGPIPIVPWKIHIL